MRQTPCCNRLECVEEIGTRCFLCETRLYENEQGKLRPVPTLWIPTIHGGTNTEDNQRMAHQRCVQIRGSLLPTDPRWSTVQKRCRLMVRQFRQWYPPPAPPVPPVEQVRKCVGKMAHPDQKAALQNAKVLNTQSARTVLAYRCEYCGFWHVGRSSNQMNRKGTAQRRGAV